MAERLDISVRLTKLWPQMRSRGIATHILGAMALAVGIYIGGFTLDQHLRTRRGPWEVTFTNEPNGDAAIVINQPKLKVRNLKIVFAGDRATNVPQTVAFNFPQKPVPLGKMKFEDLTYLPGTLTFDLFGHEIELLPRTLYLNRKPRPWRSDETILLSAAEKPLSLPEPKPKTKKWN